MTSNIEKDYQIKWIKAERKLMELGLLENFEESMELIKKYPPKTPIKPAPSPEWRHYETPNNY